MSSSTTSRLPAFQTSSRNRRTTSLFCSVDIQCSFLLSRSYAILALPPRANNERGPNRRRQRRCDLHSALLVGLSENERRVHPARAASEHERGADLGLLRFLDDPELDFRILPIDVDRRGHD